MSWRTGPWPLPVIMMYPDIVVVNHSSSEGAQMQTFDPNAFYKYNPAETDMMRVRALGVGSDHRQRSDGLTYQIVILPGTLGTIVGCHSNSSDLVIRWDEAVVSFAVDAKTRPS